MLEGPQGPFFIVNVASFYKSRTLSHMPILPSMRGTFDFYRTEGAILQCLD